MAKPLSKPCSAIRHQLDRAVWQRELSRYRWAAWGVRGHGGLAREHLGRCGALLGCHSARTNLVALRQHTASHCGDAPPALVLAGQARASKAHANLAAQHAPRQAERVIKLPQRLKLIDRGFQGHDGSQARSRQRCRLVKSVVDAKSTSALGPGPGRTGRRSVAIRPTVRQIQTH